MDVTLTTSIELGFLLAAPRLGDLNFVGSVVLLGLHDDDTGSMGWTVNGDDLEVAAKIVRATGLVTPEKALPPSFDQSATVGGPVSPESVWLLHRVRAGEDALPGTITVGDEIGVSSAPEALAMLIDGRGPSEFRLLIGYAGWGPGQLAGEVSKGVWLPTAADPALLFGDPKTMWQRAYERAIGSIPAAFVMPSDRKRTLN